MNSRTLLLAFGALASAGLTGWLVNNWLDRQRANMATRPAVAAPAPDLQVLVAGRTLGAGVILTPEHLEWRAWPRDGLVDAYAVKGEATPEDFTGAVVRRGLAAGEPVTKERVVKPGERGFLAAVLTPGMRALSVPVNAEAGVSGLVLPGDRVDIIVTHEYAVTTGKERERSMHRASETVLTNIRVLAIGQKTHDQNGQPIVAKTATLEVTPRQAEMVTLAVELGKLSLSLRSLARVDGSALAPGRKDVDTTPDRGFSYTRDTEISRLIRRPGEQVHVLRGSTTKKGL